MNGHAMHYKRPLVSTRTHPTAMSVVERVQSILQSYEELDAIDIAAYFEDRPLQQIKALLFDNPALFYVVKGNMWRLRKGRSA